MGGGGEGSGGASQGAGVASQGAGSQEHPVDLTGRGESCSQNVTSPSPQTNAPTAAEACDSLQQFLATYIDSEEEDGAPSSEHSPSTAGPSHPTPDHETEGVDDGEDSEELDSADTGPSGECSTKRGAPVTTSVGGGKRRKK